MLLIEQLRRMIQHNILGIPAIALDTEIDEQLLIDFVEHGTELPLIAIQNLAGCLGVQLTAANLTVRREWLRSRETRQEDGPSDLAHPFSIPFTSGARTRYPGTADHHELN